MFQRTGEVQDSFWFYQIIACYLDITLLGQVTGADRRTGLEVRIYPTGLSLFLSLEHRSWRLSIFIAQVWGGFISLSVLGFPLCRVLTGLMRNCLNSEKLHTLFIRLRLVISIFWSAWVCFPAHSIQTHKNKHWKCYHNQNNNHWQNNTGIRGAGWRRACIFCILSALRLWDVFWNWYCFWG